MKRRLPVAFIPLWMPKTLLQIALYLLMANLCFAKNANAQDLLNKTVTLSVQNTEVKKVISQLQSMTQTKFIFSTQAIDGNKKISVTVSNKTLKAFMDEVFKPLNIDYRIVNDQVLLYRSITDVYQAATTQQLFSAADADRTITGNVTDSSGAPLVGASVTIQGTTRGTTTDAQGSFQLSIPEGNVVLEIASVGYQTQTVSVGTQTSLRVVMQGTTSGLNEVVVVGYTSQRKRDLTGAVSIISSKDINSIPVGGVDQIMQGKAAGVSITQQTGAPGDAIAVRIRGISTIGNNDPLYVIDGVPTRTGISEISPNDIESINILKDASSAAIYGARAGNGVVIVTTKKGRSGKSRVSANAYTGFQTPANLIKMANTQQYVAAYNVAATADGREQIPRTLADTLPDVNWQKEILSTAPISNVQASVSGGNETSNYILSANYFTQDGMIDNSSFNRFNIRTAINSTLSKIFKVGTNINLSYSKQRVVGTSGDGFGDGNPGASVMRYALFRTPATPVYNANGDLVDIPQNSQFFGDGLNPKGLADNTDRNFYRYGILGDAFLEITPIKNLRIRTDIGGNFTIVDYKQFFPTWGIDRFINSPNSLAQSNANEWNYNWTNTATYTFHVGSKHTISLLAGSEAIEDIVKQLSSSRRNFVDQSGNFQYLDNGLGTRDNDGNESRWSLFSLFGRVDYNYNDKFLAAFNYRRDGSSRLVPDNRYGDFYSGSVGYRIDQENFLKNSRTISLLKVRAGIGQLGNQEIPLNAYTSTIGASGYYPFGGTATQGYSVTAEGYPDIRWEITTQTDAGIDLGLFKNSLTITADYFIKNTTGVLLGLPFPSSGGNSFATPTVNAGKIRNEGVEIEAAYHGNTGKKFTYDIIGNFATLKNKAVSLASALPLPGGRVDNNYFATLTTAGQPVGEFYLLQDEGIFQNSQEVFSHAYQGNNIQPGDVKFKDVSGPNGKPDGVIDNYDRVYAGSPLPKFTYGFTGNFGYAGFDLSLFFQGVYGNKLYNQINTDIEGFYRAFNLTERAATEYWHGEGTSNSIPRLSWTGAANNKYPSTRFLENGSYLRLKNVQLGYTLPRTLMQRLRLSSIRVFASAQNVFTITKYTGLDPEQYISNNSLGDGVRAVGIDWGTYPSARTYTFGVSANF